MPNRAHQTIDFGRMGRRVLDVFRQTGVKQRPIGEFVYAAKSWNRQRRVIANPFRLMSGCAGPIELGR